MKKIKNPDLKNILSALIVVVLGFVLLNITFMVYGVITNGILLFFPDDFAATSRWFMPVTMSAISLLIIWGVIVAFRSKIGEIYKAVLLTVPSAIILMTVGMTLFRWPVFVYFASGLVIAAVFYYFYIKKQPWSYYFSVIIVGIALLVMTLTGAEI